MNYWNEKELNESVCNRDGDGEIQIARESKRGSERETDQQKMW